MKDGDAENHRPYGPYARPYGVGGAKGEMVGGLHKQAHAQNRENYKTAKPQRVLYALLRLGDTKAKREPTLA